MDRAQTLGEKFSVAAMTSEDVISRSQQEGLSNGGRLLPDREVGRALVIISDSAKASELLDLIEQRILGADFAKFLSKT